MGSHSPIVSSANPDHVITRRMCHVSTRGPHTDQHRRHCRHVSAGRLRLAQSRDVLPASQPDGWATHAAFLDERGWFPVSVGSFLVRAADRAILVDLGLGAVDFSIPDVADFRGGGLLEALEAEGLTPGDIDTVVYTHLHHDHVGWTTDVAPAPSAPDGRAVTGLTFPNARHLVSEAEWAYWSGTSELVGPDPVAVQQPLAAVIGFIAGDEEIAPGVRVLATPGHTPGHSSLQVTDTTGNVAAGPRRSCATRSGRSGGCPTRSVKR